MYYSYVDTPTFELRPGGLEAVLRAEVDVKASGTYNMYCTYSVGAGVEELIPLECDQEIDVTERVRMM